MNYIKNMREALKDPKKKALTQLGLYAIFFAFVFILVGISKNVPSNQIIDEYKTSKEVYEDMISYDYKVTYTNIDKIDIIEGTYYNNASLFTYNNLKYYYEDSLYAINSDSYSLANIEYNILKIFNNNLYNIFNDLEEVSKTTYKDGMVVTNYTANSNKIYSYLFDAESTYTNNVNINIKIISNI